MWDDEGICTCVYMYIFFLMQHNRLACKGCGVVGVAETGWRVGCRNLGGLSIAEESRGRG